MNDWPWRTYPYWGERWIEELDVPGYVKGQLRRERNRLARLVKDAKWLDAARTPIAAEELADLKHDLGLWNDPRAVAQLISTTHVLGDKARPIAIEAIQRLTKQAV